MVVKPYPALLTKRVTERIIKLAYNYRVGWTSGAPGWNRTNDPQLRRLMLYPTELRAHVAISTS
ncbi:hypothetical protein COMA2_110010 [Candidatus Nitrospira nitrificans]|uniref:Uncharacterized protein n=1 Tax=Candidatus Nitrospira nitrificans TaxID=1742973 RepID=A0A0S4L4P2_9BACT|nr:hypothetical protein COMA2_110010 [Candidatus Nitrospira nitrificans]